MQKQKILLESAFYDICGTCTHWCFNALHFLWNWEDVSPSIASICHADGDGNGNPLKVITVPKNWLHHFSYCGACAERQLSLHCCIIPMKMQINFIFIFTFLYSTATITSGPRLRLFVGFNYASGCLFIGEHLISLFCWRFLKSIRGNNKMPICMHTANPKQHATAISAGSDH